MNTFIFRHFLFRLTGAYRNLSPRRIVWLACLGCSLSVAHGQQHIRPSSPDSASALVEKAKQLVQGGDPKAALAVLEQAEAASPRNSDVHALSGICQAMLGKPLESAAEFDQAIALRPDYAPTYFSAGLAFASFNDLTRALDRLSSAVRLDPNLPGARFNYALVLARAGNYAESEKQVDLELASRSPKTESSLELWRLKARDAYYQKEWQTTLDAYRKTLAIEPNSAEAYGAIGEALYSLHRPRESLAALEKAVALDDEDGRAHELLGRLYQDEGRQNDAILQLEAAHRLRPEDQEATYRLFRLYTATNNTAKASRLQGELESSSIHRKTQSEDEAKAAMLNNAGLQFEKNGDLTKALDQYEQAAKADPSNIVFQRNAALLLCKMGRPQEAIARLHEILAVDSDDAESLQILAVAQEMVNGTAAHGKSSSGSKPTLPASSNPER
ncbi:MAG TPA: tetratricopeptide repeat protein [Acidobacteriaceae bacterium]|nr:tetratricopeptide repeat protein [Acidobacteriaceae bacterium]